MWTKILCCFHDESTPSAQYSDDGGYVCFSCGVKGQLYYLLKEVKNLDDSGATKLYQEITGGAYEGVRSEPSLFPGGEVPTRKRDYERGSELFPSWFRG